MVDLADRWFILLTPSLKESRSSVRTISDGNLFMRIIVAG